LNRIFLFVLTVSCLAHSEIRSDTIVTGTDTVVVDSSFFPDGHLKKISRFGNRTTDGDQLEWYQSGKLKSRMRSMNGCLKDTAFSFFENGKLKLSTPFVNCKEEGIKKGWTVDGFQYLTKPYHNGLPIGRHEEWFAHNKPKQLTSYDSLGRRQGLRQTWREDGTRKDSVVFKDDNIAEIREYFNNGTIRLFEKYTGLDVVDTGVYFAPDGKNKSFVSKGNGQVLIFGEERKECFAAEFKDGKQLWIRPLSDALKK